MPVKTSPAGRETGNRHQGEGPQRPKWNLVAMGEVGLSGWTKVAAQLVARAVARRTGRPEAQILALIGAGFLAISLVDFLRQVDAVIAAGRTTPSAGQGRSHRTYTEGPARRRHLPAGPAAAGSEGRQPR
jgi:hypothetical protein